MRPDGALLQNQLQYEILRFSVTGAANLRDFGFGNLSQIAIALSLVSGEPLN